MERKAFSLQVVRCPSLTSHSVRAVPVCARETQKIVIVEREKPTMLTASV